MISVHLHLKFIDRDMRIFMQQPQRICGVVIVQSSDRFVHGEYVFKK